MATKKNAGTSTDVPVVETPSEIWKAEPDEHDYPAARSFLSLLTTAKRAKVLADGGQHVLGRRQHVLLASIVVK